MRVLVALMLFVASPISAQTVGAGGLIPGPQGVPGISPDVSALATKSEVSAVQATIPQPASAVPPFEAISPTIGTPGTYRPADSVIPRITRAGSCTLIAGGTCTITWATATASTPMVILQPINTAATQPMSCNPTASPTTTSVSIKCWTLQTTTLSLAIVTTGLNLAPASTSAAGVVVQAIAIPLSQ